jgi:apolipoprotein N-acyltransferase
MQPLQIVITLLFGIYWCGIAYHHFQIADILGCLATSLIAILMFICARIAYTENDN